MTAYAGMMSFSVSPSIIKYETVQGGNYLGRIKFFVANK